MRKRKSLIITNRFKNFSPEKKLDLSMQLYFSAKELKRAALKQFHPDWNDSKINEEVRKVFLNART
ncbi:MAG: hypothetical protein COZ80_03735 [Ignavibacteria bacterium CG_4_8_14_3_um_filter_37_9]|nr:hypothetical protein [Ignavibacteria bacterium]PIW99763.1 MAG: hypothetical protein COZ80_03735 [Ignavibacteria bacterium CG_4_8_14_3_um_filter_37_9]